GEGRGLSSRQTQDAVRDLEIGKPINSEQRAETADGVARESEGRTRLSLLCSLRQDQPRRHSGACLCPVPPKWLRHCRRRPFRSRSTKLPIMSLSDAMLSGPGTVGSRASLTPCDCRRFAITPL